MAGQTVAAGAALRSLRLLAGLTLKQVAHQADTAISYLSKVERGELAPSQEYVAKVAYVISRGILREAAAGPKEKAAA